MGFRPDFLAGPQVFTDGSTASGQAFRVQRDGSLMVSESHGKYYEGLSRGLVYKATTLTAGIALIVAATTGNHPTLWNPGGPFQGGLANAEFAQLTLARVSGTDAPGALYWCSTLNTGSTIATAGPVATFTNVSPLNALAGGTPLADNIMRWAPAVNTYTAAPVFWSPAGITLFTGTVAAVIAEITLSILYDGDIGVSPSAALSLTTQAATSTALYAVELTYQLARA
jgi:hypothetical protein